MVTSIIKRNGYFYCGNCRMRQHKLQSYCYFCGYEFSNYISVKVEEVKENEHEGN